MITEGPLVLFSGDFVGRGEGLDYWRERLGWVGEKPLRKVYNRYEAVGNPIRPNLSPRVRFVWVVTKGEWVEKSAVRDAGRRRENMGVRSIKDDEPEKVLPAKKKGAGRPKGKGPGRPKGSGRKGAAGGGDAAPPPPPPAPRPARGGKKRKAEETSNDAEVPAGETTTGRAKRVCLKLRRNQS